MSEFKTIETQEQLNEVLKERLERERTNVRTSVQKEYEEKYKDYDTYKTQVKSFNDEKEKYENEIKDLKEKATLYDSLQTKYNKLETDSLKVKVALKNGIPFELATKLSGDDEEAITKDALSIAKFLQAKQAPMRNPEAKTKDAGEQAYKNLVKGLKIED